jgi:hypothetical protein
MGSEKGCANERVPLKEAWRREGQLRKAIFRE